MQKTWLHTFFAQYSRKFFFSFLFFYLKSRGGTGGTKAELGPLPEQPLASHAAYTHSRENLKLFSFVCAKTFKLAEPYTGKNYLDSNCDSACFIKIISFIRLE